MSLNAKPARRKSTLQNPIALAAIGVAVLAVAFLGWQMLKPKAPKDPYRTEAVATGDVTKSVSASGSLQALVTVQVGSQISGQITKVMVDFNDQVRKGQVMAILDPQTYVSRANQGRAQVQAGNASLAQAEAQAAVAKANYDRTRMLYDKGIAAKAALDADLAAWKVALANVKSAQANIAQSKASLASTEVDLGRTTIVAPIDGVVVDRQIEPGQTVAASLQAPVLFQIAQDLTQLEVKINVDEADIGQVREGQTVKFTVDAFPDETFTGVVTQVRKQPETQSNVVAYIVIARADNPGGRLLPGMTANADIVIDERKNVLKVPVAALRWAPADKTATPRGFGGPPGGGPGGPPGGGGFGQRPGGQGGQGGLAARLTQQLDLDAGQQAKAKVIFDSARQNVMAAGYSDPQARREAMRTAMQAAFAKLEPILKPEQKQKLVALRAQMAAGGQRRGGFTAGVVWVLKDGKPTAVPVMVGANDGSYAEIRGNIQAGTQVITGGGPKAKVKANSPMGGAPVRVRM
jgi:HlyD family secretion protein